MIYDSPILSIILLGLLIIALPLAIYLAIYWERKKNYYNVELQNLALLAARKINKIILEDLDFELVTQKIADYIPSEFKFATGVVAILDKEKGVIRRIAASRTKEAEEAIKALRVPFPKIEISINDPNNLMAKSIREKRKFSTNDVFDVLGPVISREEAKQIQKIMSTRTTLIYPIFMGSNPIGVFLASTKKREEQLTEYELDIIDAFVDGAGIALQHAILYKNIKDKTELLRIANERLRELDKLKDEFVSLASHELRTPMTAIKSYLWMALHGKGGELNEKQKYYLDRAYNSTERLIKLVNNMLNVSRIESGRITLELEKVDLVTLVGEVIAEVKPRADEMGVALVQKSPHDIRTGEIVQPVLADPDKIKEVLINIIGNSIKFTPKGGTISIEFSTGDGFIETSITDTGRGISKEDLAKLFQKFGILEGSYTAAQKDQGTGLGLYITRSIVELHGGQIWAESEGEGKGATFRFTLKIFTKDDEAKIMPHPQEKESIGIVHTEV